MAIPFHMINEPQRNYNFSWSLTPGSLTQVIRQVLAMLSGESIDIQAILTLIFNKVYTSYVSTLATKVAFPDMGIELTQLNLSTFDYPIIKKVKISDIRVTYIDDQFSTVYNFHRAWMSIAFASSGMGVLPMDCFTLQGIFATTVPIALLQQKVDVPTTSVMFESIFPSNIQRSEFDNAGNSYTTVTVTYTRVPKVTGWDAYFDGKPLSAGGTGGAAGGPLDPSTGGSLLSQVGATLTATVGSALSGAVSTAVTFVKEKLSPLVSQAKETVKATVTKVTDKVKSWFKKKKKGSEEEE